MSVYLKFEDGAGNPTAVNTGYAGGPFTVSPHSISASYAKSGTGSLRLAGTNGGTMPFTGITGPGTGDYTAEMWVLFPTMPGISTEFCGSYGGGFFVGPDFIGGQANGYIESAPGSLSAGVWYHIALCRSGSTVRFFLSGALVGSLTDTSSISFPFQLGEDGPYAAAVVAHVDEYRFTNSALYTSAFTPQSPLVPDTKLFSGSASLADVAATGAFGVSGSFTSSITLDDVTSVGTLGSEMQSFSSTVTLGDVTSIGTLGGEIQSFSGALTLDDGVATSTFDVTDPVAFSMNKVVPAATLFAEVVPYEGFRLDGTIPAATGIAWLGIRLDKTLPSAQLLAVGIVPNTLRLAAELPKFTLSANILNGRSLSVNTNVPPVSLSAWTGWKLSASVPVVSMTGDVVTGGAYRLHAAVPMASVQSSAVAVNVLRLTATLPAAMRSGWVAVNKTAPAAKMVGSILPVVAITRLAYSFTLANSAMTRYPSYPFIQVFRMGNAYYGVAEDGLYELGGATDNGADIPWAWETCMSDFGVPEKKTVVSAYLGGYVPQSMAYTIKAGDLPTGTNAHTTTATAVLRNHRQKFGIGRKSRFFAFGLSATKGRVAIESIEFELAKMSRRV